MSGGADSLALLVLAVAAGCRVDAIHVDHGLRPGSSGEGAVVEAAARRFGAGFRSVRVEVGEGSNLEARARAARFGVLPAEVATGHTMDDQAETVLANLLRGSGLDGLSGMAPGFRHPLLALRRHETRALCRAVGLTPVSDPSNDDPRHLRNRIRHQLLPLCAELASRDPVPVLARQAGVLRDEAALLEELARAAVPDPSDTSALAAAPRALARRAVRRWLRQAGTRSRAAHPPSGAEVARVLSVADGSLRATELSGGRRWARSRGHLVEGTEPSGKVTPMQTEDVAPATPAWASPEIGPVVVGSEDLQARVAELGAQVTSDYADGPRCWWAC